MVTPLPHKATAHKVICLDHLKIILEISRTISHAVTVLHKKKRLTAIPVKILLYLLKGRIHTAVEIKIFIVVGHIIITIPGALILGYATMVEFLSPRQGSLEITSVGTFISHGPHNY